MQARFSLPLGSEYRRVPSRRHTMSSRWPGMNCSIHLCSWKTDLFKLSFRFLFSVVNSTLTQPNYRGSKYWCRKGSMLDALSVSNRESRMYQSQINWKRSKWWFPKRWAYGRIHALHQCTWDPCIGGHTPRYLLHWEYYFIISYFIFFSSFFYLINVSLENKWRLKKVYLDNDLSMSRLEPKVTYIDQ